MSMYWISRLFCSVRGRGLENIFAKSNSLIILENIFIWGWWGHLSSLHTHHGRHMQAPPPPDFLLAWMVLLVRELKSEEEEIFRSGLPGTALLV